MKEKDIADCETLRSGTEAAVRRVLERFTLDSKLRKFLEEKYHSRLPAEDRMDIRQESLAGLWAYVKSGRFRGDCSLKTLFERIAERKFIDFLRKKGRYRPLPDDFGQNLAETEPPDWLSAENVEALWFAFAAWSKVCPEICPDLLKAWAEKEALYKEIEARFGLQEGQGRRKSHDCKEHFKTWLRKNPAHLKNLR